MSIVDETAPIQEQAYTDYFGFSEEHKFMLPDAKQYFTFRVMNEGDKS